VVVVVVVVVSMTKLFNEDGTMLVGWMLHKRVYY
jgi:hypothetical protein